METVYFLQLDNLLGPIKIGYTKHPIEKRMKEIQMALSTQPGYSGTLLLLKTVQGNPIIERAIHKQFHHLRINGEWFKPEKELLDFIEKASSLEKKKKWKDVLKIKGTNNEIKFIRRQSLDALVEKLSKIDESITSNENEEEKKFILEGRLSMENIIQNKKKEWGLI